MEYLELNAAYGLAVGAPSYRQLQAPRDPAWWRLHQTLARHERTAALDDLRHHLGSQCLPGHRIGHAIRDAATATLAQDLLNQGPFTTADYDILLAPWLAATGQDARSRLALILMSRWPGPADELWVIVDATLD